MQAELERANIGADFFPAVQVSEHQDWPGLGARGCFLSHYTILKSALESDLRNVLVIEDDVDFSPRIEALASQLVEQLAGQPWEFLYLGHIETGSTPPGDDLQLLDWRTGVATTHFYAVNGPVLPRLVAYLEQVMSRPAGHSLGGPQHVDGAYSMFRAQNPEVRTLLAWPVLGFQRSSKSDINPARRDSLPVLGDLIGIARSVRRRLLRRLPASHS